MIESIILAALSIVAMLLPGILAAMEAKKKETDALTRRSVDELHAADGVQPPPPVQP